MSSCQMGGFNLERGGKNKGNSYHTKIKGSSILITDVQGTCDLDEF